MDQGKYRPNLFKNAPAPFTNGGLRYTIVRLTRNSELRSASFASKIQGFIRTLHIRVPAQLIKVKSGLVGICFIGYKQAFNLRLFYKGRNVRSTSWDQVFLLGDRNLVFFSSFFNWDRVILNANKVYIVRGSQRSITKYFTRFRIALGSDPRCRFLRILLSFVMGLINWAGAAIMRNRRRSFSFRNQVRLKFSGLCNIRRLTSSFRNGVFALRQSGGQVNYYRNVSHSRTRQKETISRGMIMFTFWQ